MLSVILYGRNDSYGYNLHKRAALSINCISELLDHDDDELLFVDYNTPDDLPTFPEAIQDTLTASAKERLRILRVRPETHRRFQHLTHLVALEPVARNVALRRSNPANRWILSTNTDMIFVPRAETGLSRILPTLPQAFYHLPRFEIPESLWETFDRSNPQQVIGTVRAWASDARLNEVVYGSDIILYDGPGDFQLVPRDVLFGIDGFDERMLLGWHVDSNMARRLRLALGAPQSFLDHLFGYHCDHTRMATPAHRRDRVENDPERFVSQLACADIPEQADLWGCPDDPIEEIRLTPGETAYARMLRRRIAPLNVPFTEAFYRAESYDDFRYDPGHVLPFLTDLFVAAPRRWNVAWVGCRPRTLALFAEAWRDLGFTGKILLSGRCDALASELPAGVEIRNHASLLRNADAFVFEVGLPDEEPEAAADGSGRLTDRTLGRFQLVRRAFLDSVAAERVRLRDTGQAPRRFAFVNAIHNRFEELVTKHLGITFTPYSTRIRHGYVYSEAPARAERPPNRDPGRRREPLLSRAETQRLIDLVDRLRAAGPQEELAARRAAMAADPLLLLFERRDAASLFKLPSEATEGLKGRIASLRRSAELDLEAPFAAAETVAEPEGRPLTRAAEYFDWNSPRWLGWVEAIADTMNPQAWYNRSSWLWERAHALYGLSRLGALAENRTALVAALGPDRLIGAMSEVLGRVDLLPLAARGRADRKSIGDWSDGWHVNPNRVRLPEGRNPLPELPSGSYDAVVFLHAAIASRGAAGLIRFLVEAARLLRPGGHLVFSANALLAAAEGLGADDWFIPTDDRFWAGVQAEIGLRLEGPFDGAVSRASIDRAWEADRPAPGQNYFVSRNAHGQFLIPAVWFLSKTEDRPAPRAVVVRALRKAVLGHGAPLPTGPSGRANLRRFRGADLGRLSLHWGDMHRLIGLVQDALNAPAGRPQHLLRAARHAEPLLPLLDLPAASSLFGQPNPLLTRVRQDIAAARLSARLPLASWVRVEDEVPPPQSRGLTRAAEYFDWDSPDWLNWVGDISDAARPEGAFARSAWLWERAQTLYGLGRLGLLDAGHDGLIAAVYPDVLIGALSGYVRRADVIGLGDRDDADTTDAEFWTENWAFEPARLNILPRETRLVDLPSGSYDFVVFPHSAVASRGAGGLVRFLAEAARLLRPGGCLVLSADAHITRRSGREPELWVTPDIADFWPNLLARLGLEPDRPFDGILSRASIDRVRGDEAAFGTISHFVDRNPSGDLVVPSTWFLRKTASGPAPTESIERMARAAALGDRLPWMHLGRGAERRDGPIAVSAAEGHAAFGPYDILVPGDYEVAFKLEEIVPRPELEIVVEAAVGALFLAQERLVFDAPRRTAEARCRFRAPALTVERSEGLEYRVWSNGRGTFTIGSIFVEAVG